MAAWAEIELAGHPCDVFEPADPHDPAYVVIYLHGLCLQRIVDNPAFTDAFEQHGLRVVAPMTQRSWWTDRICAEFDPEISAEQYLLKNVLVDIQQRWHVVPPQIALLGTGMGGQGALRCAFKHPHVFPIVAALAPAIDYQLLWDESDEVLPRMYRDAEAVRQDTATLHIHPLNWPRQMYFCCDPTDLRWYESVDRLRMKLDALGIPHQCDMETQDGGHGLEYYNRMAPVAVNFIADRLDHERLRVV